MKPVPRSLSPAIDKTMSNLKAIRDRIDSVKNTKKITEAMRLVASTKVRRLGNKSWHPAPLLID